MMLKAYFLLYSQESLLGTIREAGDWTRVGSFQDKGPTTRLSFQSAQSGF